jgi:predicted PurR-regulated permease PerM
VIGLVAALWAIKWAYPVFMPLAASAFLVGMVYPVYAWLRERTNGAIALLAAFLTVVAGFAAFFWVTGWAISSVASQLPEYEAELRRTYAGLRSAAEAVGLSLPPPDRIGGSGASGSGALDGWLGGVAQSVGYKAQAFVTYLLLTLAFVALGLAEVQAYGHKMRAAGGLAAEMQDAAAEMGHKFRAYLGAVTFSALITAVLSAGLAFAVGLEFALVFALLSFLMNYVPTIGSVIAIVPPTLFALVQFDGVVLPLVVFLGFSAIELTVGNYVAPKIEGRILSLAPTVVLAAIVFWGWIWGIVGALLAVPLTIALATFCDRFAHTRWVSILIREDVDESDDSPHAA